MSVDPKAPVSLHDHPTNDPVIIVHSHSPLVGPGHPAHAFGPFPNEAAAREWQANGEVDDDCYKTILDLVDPGGAIFGGLVQ